MCWRATARGAVMAVPAHDARDFAFAQLFGLPIPVVITPPDWDGEPLAEAYTADGTLVHSGRFDGLGNEEAKGTISAHLESEGWGGPMVQYRLRDWLISRQRYWGAPITDRLLRRLRDRARAGGAAADRAALRRRVPADRAVTAAAVGGVRADLVPGLRTAGAARDGHDGHVHVLLVVLHALRGPAQHVGAGLARGRRGLAAGRSVHGRRRARDDAPAVRAVLLQGGARRRDRARRRAVHALLRAGPDPRAGRAPHVEVAPQRGAARRPGGALGRGHVPRLRDVPRGRGTRAGRTTSRASSGSRAGCVACGRSSSTRPSGRPQATGSPRRPGSRRCRRRTARSSG